MPTTRHTSVLQHGPRRKWIRGALAAGLLAGTVGVIGSNASASHGNAELSGSNFEIDDDANLKNDDGAPHIDWADLAHPNGPELRATDVATGQTDDSYKGGVKEDTECPNETTGSIPNNKSDLLTFHVYEEPGSPGFLNLAWSRVSDPSGTTLMDFEFNQSTTACPQGPNVERTDGDILIEYAIDQGGARADISGRFWDAAAGEWGPSVDLDSGTACGGNPCAVGTINQSVIPVAPFDESDGLGEKQPRTFGEAQIDLDLIFDDGKCSSFGSAMLKSRSSDSFTSQLKDFIRPIPIDLQNCGNVIIRKQTNPDEDPNTTSFGYTKAFNTDPATGDTFSLTDDGVKDFNDDVLFGTGYTVTEDTLPSGWDLTSIDCSASSNVTALFSNSTVMNDTPEATWAPGDDTVTFDIDSDEDELDCTYTNTARATLTVVKQTVNAVGAFDFTSSTLTPNAFTLTTTAEGAPGASQEFANLTPGTYDVAESGPPDGWTLATPTCDNGNSPAAVTLAAGDDVTCTFVNTATADLTIIKQTTDGQTGTFDFASTSLDPSSFSLTTTGDGAAGQDSKSYPGIAPGAYDVAETVPMGWNLATPTCDNGDDPASITLGIGDDVTCTFVNSPERGAVEIVKTRKHAADGTGDHAHAGVDFTVSGGSLATPVEVTTDENGVACVDGVLLSTFVGDYTVVETLPTGYVADQPLSQSVTVTTESTCGDGNEATVTFANTPLTNVSIAVASQVEGGTSTVVDCWEGTDTSGDPAYSMTTDPAAPDNGNGTLPIPNLEPTDPDVTLTCTITVDP